jgi:hypothetical protein
MSSSAITKLKSEMDAVRHRASLKARASKDETKELLARGAGTAAAFAIGYAERENKLPLTVMGGKVPLKLAVGMAMQLGALMTKGSARKFLSEAAAVTLTAYAYNAGQHGGVIAGE